MAASTEPRRKRDDPLDLFGPAVGEWFRSAFEAPTPSQARGWASIAAGRHTLIHAPTGSGKTLAAFLWCLDRLAREPRPKPPTVRVLYISPLKALIYDVERNLRAPLAGIRLAAERLGEPLPQIEVGVRTGDTPADERRHLVRNPPDILITTPESLYLILTSQAAEILRGVEHVIVDEVHAVAGSKRGAHLALSLERLECLTARPPQRIGLSATQRPVETIARFLGGIGPGRAGESRDVTIVDAGSRKPLELSVRVPVEDMTRLGDSAPADGPGGAAPPGSDNPEARHSIWPAIHPQILELIREHHSTIVFCNSRRLAERLANKLNELAGEELVRAHHGSLAREQRVQIEEALKAGRLPAIVATSSLELGIDMGAVDLVIQVESPASVASGLQRIGRAGHQVGEPSRGIFFPKYRGDLLETAVVTAPDARSRYRGDQAAPQPARRPGSADRCHDGARGVAGGRAVRHGSAGGSIREPHPRRLRGGPRDARRRIPERTNSPISRPGSCGTAKGAAWRAGATPEPWRSPAAARSRTAACTRCSWSARRALRGDESASSTRRWSTKAASAKSLRSGQPAGEWRRSDPTA